MTNTARLLGIVLVSISFCIKALPQATQESEELSRLDSLLNETKGWKPENVEKAKAAILEMARTTQDPAFAERIAQAIRAGELTQAEDIVKAIPESLCGDAFTALLGAQDPYVVLQGLAFQERAKDVDVLLDLLKKLLQQGTYDTLWKTADILACCSLPESQCEELVQLIETGLSNGDISRVTRVLSHQQLTDGQRARVLENLCQRAESREPDCAVTLAQDILGWENSPQTKKRVTEAILNSAERLLSEAPGEWRYPKSYVEALDRCDPDEKAVRRLLRVAEQQGETDPYFTFTIKQLCRPPLPLTSAEQLEGLLQFSMPGYLSGLLDLSSYYLGGKPEPGLEEVTDSGPLLSDENATFLLAHRTEVVQPLLDKLRTDGNPYAALLLGWLKEKQALPLLRFWYLHAHDDDWGFEGQDELHFNTESYLWRYAYEKAIQNVSGVPLDSAIQLDDVERAWLIRHMRDLFHDGSPSVGDPSPELAAFMLWRLDRKTAREELLRIFREDNHRLTRARDLIVQDVLDELLEGVTTRGELRRLLGDPDDQSCETSHSSLLRQYSARLGGWEDRWIYRTGLESDEGRRHAAICLFFEGERLVHMWYVPRGTDPDNPDWYKVDGLLPERTWPPALLIEGFQSPSSEVRLLAINLINPEADAETLLPHLIRLLEDSDENVRREAAFVIERIREKSNE